MLILHAHRQVGPQPPDLMVLLSRGVRAALSRRAPGGLELPCAPRPVARDVASLASGALSASLTEPPPLP